MELELPERLSAPLDIEALRDLIEQWEWGCVEPTMSPPLCLGWDIHCQWPNAEGFAIWRDLMHTYEPPLLVNELLQGDPRQAVTMELYEAYLVETWASYDREKHWTDSLIVDVMDEERQRGYEPCGVESVVLRTEAILDDLAARSGAKRAAAEAAEQDKRDARHARRMKRMERFYELDDAGYAKWVADGMPFLEGMKWVRWDWRRLQEILESHREPQREALPPIPAELLQREAAPMPSKSDAPASTTAPRYLFETVGDLRSMPPQTWLADRWIPEFSTGIIFGRFASGKSFFAFDLLLHLAYGFKEWHGARLPGVPCDVLLIAREGHTGFRRRVDAFKKHHNITDDTDKVVFMRCPVNFGDTAQFAELKAAIEASGRKFKAVVVDTVGRALPGEDMFDPKSITKFMEHLQQLGEISKGVAIGVHHENKSGDVMGSVYFQNNSDFVFQIEREGDPKREPLRRGKISCVKMKDGEDGWHKLVSYKFIETEPSGEGSLVIDSLSTMSGIAAEAVALSDRQTNMLHALREAIKTHGKVGRVHMDKWREVSYNRGFLSDDATKRSKEFDNAKATLIKKLLVRVDNGMVEPRSNVGASPASARVNPDLGIPPLPELH